MIRVTAAIAIAEEELLESFVRASGPGGQNVNKVSTAVELRFDVRNSPSLPAGVKARLAGLAGRRLSKDGVLVLRAQRFRTQDANREDALARLVALIASACHVDPPRRPTRPTRSSQRRRVDDKVRRGTVKALRGRAPDG